MSIATVNFFLALLGCCNALKIAVGENHQDVFGTGSGSGSGSPSPSPSPAPLSSSPSPAPVTGENEATVDVPLTVDASGAPVPPSTPTTVTDPSGSGITFTVSPAAMGEVMTKVLAAVPACAAGGCIVRPKTFDPPPAVLALVGPSPCAKKEATMVAVLPSGVETAVPIAGNANPMGPLKFPGCKAKVCATWSTTALSWVTTGASGTPAKGCFFTSLSTKSGIGGFGGASGDPKATNLAGQKFEILAMGTFQLLSISHESSLETKFTLDATIDRAGEMCGATYIKNISMTGSWIQETDGLNAIKVRAAADMPKQHALQVSLGSAEWKDLKELNEMSIPIIKKASAGKLEFLIHDVTVETKIDSHRVRVNGVKTKKFANFLNVNVKGLKEAQQEGVHLGGLLAYDDHEFAAEIPDGCKTGKLANLKQKLDSSETDAQINFLSTVDVE